MIAGAGRRALERLPGMPRRRIDDLPFAAVALRRLLRADRRAPRGVQRQRAARGLVHAPHAARRCAQQDPLLAAARELAAWPRPRSRPCRRRWSTGPQPLFPNETAEAARLREAACWMSDIGSHDHPEFRAEAGVPARVAPAGHRAGPPRPRVPRAGHGAALRGGAGRCASCGRRALLLDVASAHRAEVLGMALRLAYTLSAGTPDLLAGTRAAIGRLPAGVAAPGRTAACSPARA